MYSEHLKFHAGELVFFITGDLYVLAMAGHNITFDEKRGWERESNNSSFGDDGFYLILLNFKKSHKTNLQ